MLVRLILASMVLLIVAGDLIAQDPRGCSSRARSALAMDPGAEGLEGHVLTLRSREPVRGAQVFVEPGRLSTYVAPDGRFSFPTLPQGRYQLVVRAAGYAEVRDSIVVGSPGLYVFASLAFTQGLPPVCVSPA